MPTISAPSHTATAPSAGIIDRHMSVLSGARNELKEVAASNAIAGESASSAPRTVTPAAVDIEGLMRAMEVPDAEMRDATLESAAVIGRRRTFGRQL
jgi:hypothetical protein